MWAAGAINQPGWTLGLVAVNPLIAGLTRDVVTLAEFCER